MSVQGRCAGCQETGEAKVIDWHVQTCPDLAALLRKDPAAVLAPAEEYARWRAQEAATEHAADLAGRVADTVTQRQQSIRRFKRCDPLED
jgi:PHD/YefM family antitoxin component YafN of YafNO toxin-antitoxin module